MKDQTNQYEPVRAELSQSNANQEPDVLTVSQAYEYLIRENLPRSKKTIRKWCRLNHVDWKEISVPGGAKWLITKSSLNARIAEERLIDASLTQETGPNPSAQGRTDTGANPTEPVRDDALVEVLKEQLAHEREARTEAEAKNRALIDKYHEISLASTQMGIEIGKGLQEQARARRLAVHSESDAERTVEIVARTTSPEARQAQDSYPNRPSDTHGDVTAVDKPDQRPPTPRYNDMNG